MEINGDIGQEVLIKARIRGGGRFGENVYYSVEVDNADENGNKITLYLDADQVIIKEPKTIEIKSDLVVEKPKSSHKDNDKDDEPNLFEYSLWLDEIIKQINLTKKEFTERLNLWLDAEQEQGRYEGFGHFYASDLTSYINGKKNISAIKIEAIDAFQKDFFANENDKKNDVEDMIMTGNAKRATVESTMRKLEKMRGGK